MYTLEEATWAWVEAGRRKHHMSLGVRFTKAFLAGAFLSLGGTMVDVLTADPWFTLNAPGLLKIIQGIVFPVGLIMVVIFQADLVTTQMAIVIASTWKKRVPYWTFLVDWPLVFIGNLCGALAYGGLIVHYGGILTPAMQTGAAAAADAKVATVNFREIFLAAIGCNFCVCSAVFMASLSKDVVSKIVAAWTPIFCFVAVGFQHVIANQFLVPIGLMTGQAKFGVGTYIWKSIIASVLGNIIGAAVLIVPLIYIHAQEAENPFLLVLPNPNGTSPSGTFHNANDVEKATV